MGALIRIAALGQWSVAYYESTAVRGDACGGGLSEYYAERDTRAPVMFVAGDREFAKEKMGVEHGGGISAEAVTQWFGEGVPPAGPGVGKPRPGTCGWDVLLTVPKSVSLLAALSEDPAVSAAVMQCVVDAAQDGLAYLHEHAGYTRVSNPVDPRKKDLQRLPALPFVTYLHHTARPAEDGTCDPHLHLHMLLPGKVARADGRMVTIDSQSMYHEAKAAGMIMQKSMRDRMSAALGVAWGDVDPHTGIAELAGVDRSVIEAYSRRQTELMRWAAEHGGGGAVAAATEELAAEGPGWAKGEREWLDVAQKATRHKKLETLHYDELREQWQTDPRAAGFDAQDYLHVIDTEAARLGPGRAPEPADVFALLGGLQNSWTRADLVEAVVGQWGPGRGVEVVSLAEIEAVVDEVIDAGCFQLTEDRRSWHREGNLRYTDAITLHREAEVLELCGVKSVDREIPTTRAWFRQQGLDSDAARAMAEIAVSHRLINILEAPAGSGKTTSLKALRERAEGQRRRVVLATAARKALNEAKAKDAASEFHTLAQVRSSIDDNTLDWDRKTLVVIDECSMAGDRDLYEVIKAAHAAGAKLLLIGDSYQLQPVLQSGGLFRDLSEQLPWTQTFTTVWRQRDPEEKAMTLLMRDAKTESQIRRVAHWYSTHGRLAAGDERTMADQLVRDYFEAVVEGRDVIVVADTWDKADALNVVIQSHYTRMHEEQVGYELPSAPIGHEQQARLHDIVMTRRNSWDIEVEPDPDVTDISRGPLMVTNADRWRVTGIGEDGSLWVQRLHDHARAVLPADYAQGSVTLGYVDSVRGGSVTLGYAGTIHAAQGSNAEVGLCIGDADTLHRVAAYPGLTRGTIDNRLYLTTRSAAGDSHAEGEAAATEPRVYTDIETQAMFQAVLRRDERDSTALATAEAALKALAAGEPHTAHGESFSGIDPYVAQLVHTRSVRRTEWAVEYAAEVAGRDNWEHSVERAQAQIIEQARDARERQRARNRERGISYDDGIDYGLG